MFVSRFHLFLGVFSLQFKNARPVLPVWFALAEAVDARCWGFQA